MPKPEKRFRCGGCEAAVFENEIKGGTIPKEYIPSVEKGVKEIIVLGHSGKIVKLAARLFNTHHKVGDARNEVIAAYAGGAGANQ